MEVDRRWRARMRAERIERTTQRIRSFYGVLADSDWNHPTMQRNRSQVQTVLGWQIGPRGLLLPGDTGGGKSRCMAALLLRLASEGHTEIALWKAQHLFARIAGEYRYGVDNAQEFVGVLAVAPLLVIEDLGQEGLAPNREDQTRQWFFDLLDERYANGRPLLCTTNHTRESLIEAETSREVTADPLLRRLTAVAAPVLPRFERAGGAHA